MPPSKIATIPRTLTVPHLLISRRLDGADYETFHRRLYGYMGRRGFSASISRSVISSLWRAREEGEERR